MVPTSASSSSRYRIVLLACFFTIVCCVVFRTLIDNIYIKTYSWGEQYRRREMFHYEATFLATAPLEVIQYQILDMNDKILSFEKVLNLFSDPSSGFHDFFNGILRRHFEGEKAYFMECPAISLPTVGRNFEFVLIPAIAIQNATANSSPFRDHFLGSKLNETVISFLNIGGDASLVVPCPINEKVTIPKSSIPLQESSSYSNSLLKSIPSLGNISSYAHLASFIRNSPCSQANFLWQKVAVVMNEKLMALGGHQKVWISTSGLGVAWLHVRLDTVPKYYNWEPYQMD